MPPPVRGSVCVMCEGSRDGLTGDGAAAWPIANPRGPLHQIENCSGVAFTPRAAAV